MNVFVKYCGGCNPTFDRTAFFEKLSGMFAGRNIRFEAYDRDKQYDFGLVIKGCMRECIDLAALTNTKRLFVTESAEALKAAANEIEVYAAAHKEKKE